MAAVETTFVEERLDIRLIGRIDETTGVEVLRCVRQELRRAELRYVIVHLMNLEECTILGRALLIEMQADIARSAERSAWVSNQPRFRGLALWVVHACSDANANVAPNEKLAEKWLASSENRIRDVGSDVERRIAEIRKNRRGKKR